MQKKFLRHLIRELRAAENMDVEVFHGLAGVFPFVGNQSEPVLQPDPSCSVMAESFFRQRARVAACASDISIMLA